MSLVSELKTIQPRSQCLVSHLPILPLTPAQRSLVHLALDVISQLSGYNKIIAEFILSSGARVNEILSLTPRHVSVTGHVFIAASKRSVSRVVFFPAILPYCLNTPEAQDQPIFRRHDYWRFYRAVKACTRGRAPHSMVREKVSNLFRCAAAIIASQFGQGSNAVSAEFLGHRNPHSSQYYLNSVGGING